MQTISDDPRVKLMQKWSQNMPQFGMQGAALKARANGDDDDDDDDDARSTKSGVSAYSSASAMSRSRKMGFSIGVKKSKYFTPVTLNPAPNPSTNSGAHQSTGHANNNNGGNQQGGGRGGKGKRRGKGKGKGKKGKGPKAYDIHVPKAGTEGWDNIRLTRETAGTVRLQAINNLSQKTTAVWTDLLSSSTVQKFHRVYSDSSPVVTAINAFKDSTRVHSFGSFHLYDSAVKALWNYQIELKGHNPSLYVHEPSAKPYDTNMRLYHTQEAYDDKMKKLNMEAVDYFIYNLSKLVIYFIKSLMSFEVDSFKMPTETELKALKEKDSDTSKIHLMRKDTNIPYNDLCTMNDVLTPWIIAIVKSNEVQASKYTGNNKGHKVYQGGNKYGGILPPQHS